MRPPITAISSKVPSVFVKPDIITVSRELTIDLSTFERFLVSLGPWVQALIELHGVYQYSEEQDQWEVFIETMDNIWGRKEELRKNNPGSVIINTIIHKIFLFYEKNNKIDEWEKIRQEMLSLISME